MAEYLDENGTSKIVTKITTLENDLQKNGYLSSTSVDTVELGSLPVGGKFYLNHGETTVEYVVVQKNNDSMFYFGDYMAVYVTPTIWRISTRIGTSRNSNGNEVHYEYSSPYCNADTVLNSYLSTLDESVRKSLRMVTIPHEVLESYVIPGEDKIRSRYVIRYGCADAISSTDNHDTTTISWMRTPKTHVNYGHQCYAFLPSIYELGLSVSTVSPPATNGRVFELFRLYPEYLRTTNYYYADATRTPAGRGEPAFNMMACRERDGQLATVPSYLAASSSDYDIVARPFICIDQRCPVKVGAS